MMNWTRRAGGRRKVSWLFGNAKIFTFDGNLDGNFFCVLESCVVKVIVMGKQNLDSKPRLQEATGWLSASI